MASISKKNKIKINMHLQRTTFLQANRKQHKSTTASNSVKYSKGLETIRRAGWHWDLNTWSPASANVLRVWGSSKRWSLAGESGTCGWALSFILALLPVCSPLLDPSRCEQAALYPCRHGLSCFHHPAFPTLLPSRSRVLMYLCQAFNHSNEKSSECCMSVEKGF